MNTKKILIFISIIILFSGLIWAVSRADTTPNNFSRPSSSTVKNYSAIGIVESVSSSTLNMIDVNSSNVDGGPALTFDLSNVTKIEDKYYTPLDMSQINVGDKVVVQGIDREGTIIVRRIISFAADIQHMSSTAEVVSTSTATTTEVVGSSTEYISSDTASTTKDVIATSTESVATEVDNNATSTDPATTAELIPTPATDPAQVNPPSDTTVVEDGTNI